MKQYYSIGEVSRIMGISTQTLRYYCSIDLLEPAYINPDTGYRYYTYNQFHLIDRIRYLQKMGMSLEQIREVLVHNDIAALQKHLEELEQNCVAQIRQLDDTLDTIRWYRDYFNFSDEAEQEYSYVRHFPKRHLVAVKIRDDEDNASYHLRLTSLRNRPEMKNLSYMRQYSLILDYNSLIENKLKRYYLGMFIKSAPKQSSENILEIPEGDYFCFRSRILSEGWNPYQVNMFFADKKKKPTLVLANEFENSLQEYHQCPYEVQILIEPEE